MADWLVDARTQTLSLLPAPTPKAVPSDTAVVTRAFIDKTTLTQAGLDAARAALSP